MWEYAVELLRESIFAYAQACHGNLGAGILAVSFLARLALLPIGLRVSRAMAQQQRTMARLQPALEALRKTHAGDPKRLAEETQHLFAREGVSPFAVAGSFASLAQVPVLVALYSAVRQASASGSAFLWIRNLALPDLPLAIAATAFTLVSMVPGGAGASGSTPSRLLILSVTAAITFTALSKMAAGVGLYWGLSSVFGAAQSWAAQRATRRPA